MVNTIKYYKKALGKNVKHPSKKEFNFRNVLYKKYINGEFKRANEGKDYISYKFDMLDKNNIGIAVIARGNSKRLPRKIYKPFSNDCVIVDLYNRISKANLKTFIATSTEKSDDELIELCKKKNLRYFRGHPESVLDRILSLSFENSFGGILRVTGDNPLTDPETINHMVSLFKTNKLDYVRCNGLPFGTTAELFSVKYLWELYTKINNPLNTEYLSLFVINDNECKKGCINYNTKKNIQYVNLSIDVQEDYNRCINLLQKIDKKLNKVSIKDIIENVDLNDIYLNKEIKLPTEIISLEKYIFKLKNLKYKIKVNYEDIC
jgi:spore coat polysaccharide biosynthesis protein SpsF